MLRDDAAEALGRFLLGYRDHSMRKDVVVVSGEEAPRFEPSGQLSGNAD